MTVLQPGATTISATSEGVRGSADLTAFAPLVVDSTDPILRPGTTFSIRGHGLLPATASVAGLGVAVVSSSDTLLSVTVPTSPWSPCLGDNVSFAITVRSPAGDSVVLTRPAAENPFPLALAPGRHMDVPQAATHGCRLLVSSAGSYLAVVTVPERRDDVPATPQDSSDVTMQIGGSSLSTSPTARVFSRAGPDYPRDVRFKPVSVQAPCPLPANIGGIIRRAYTRRDAQGLIAVNASETDVENWILTAIGQTVAVFVDTGTARLAASNPKWGPAIADFVARSDSEFVPFIYAATTGVSDLDQNGKLIVYITGRASPGLSNFATNSERADCPAEAGGLDSGEAIFLNWTFPQGDPPYFGFSGLIAVHEMAHIADVVGSGFRGLRGVWALEGFASFMAVLFPMRHVADPLALNLQDYMPYGVSNVYCQWSLSEALSAAPYGQAWAYTTGCELISYLYQLYRARFGGSLRDITTAWSRTSNMMTVEDAEQSFLHQPSGTAHVMAHWMASWYADDFVTGTDPELQRTMWNLRALWSQALSFVAPIRPPPSRWRCPVE